MISGIMWAIEMHRVLVVLLLMFPLHAQADATESELTCTVTSNSIVSTVKGEPKSYSGFKDEFRVGDSINITYGYNFDDKSLVYCKLVDLLRNDKFLGLGISIGSTTKVFSDDSGFSLNDKFTNSIRAFEDFISCDGPSERLFLNRYDRIDFNGIFLRDPSHENLAAHLVTLDCELKTDAREKIGGMLAHDW